CPLQSGGGRRRGEARSPVADHAGHHNGVPDWRDLRRSRRRPEFGQPRALREAFAEGEEHLVGVAKQRWFDNFAKTVKYWKQAADDDVSEKDAQKRYDERYFKARPTLGNMTDLQGRLDPVNGAIFTGELARLERAMFEADWAAAKLVHGLDTSIGHLARTTGQRNADALVEMARRSAAMEPGAVKARTLITILVGYETFSGRVCEMADGTVVTPGQVANLFHHCDGTPDDTIDAERVVFDGPSRVIDVGVRTRGFVGGIRRAIEVRDRQCTFPGCKAPAQFCHVDHITEYCDGGLTTQENGRLRCVAHNGQRPGRRSPPTSGP
ncbi:MAG: DUF222 domain-containing protein, partial [Acidimicrobiales bacterium]